MPRTAMRKTTKTRTKKSSTAKSSSKKINAAFEVEEAPVEQTPVEEVTTKTTKRRTPTRESVLEDFENLIIGIETEIQQLREGPTKTKGVKFLRSLNKNIKLLRNRTARVMKQKQRSGRSNNKNSGFLKPVPISKEMARFTGWDVNELRSRVDVTKYICNYISENNLQNPEDRRQINPDSKLRKLLGFDPKKNKEPLRYYSLQTHLKHHFPKNE